MEQKEFLKQVGRRVYEKRFAAGLTQYELAAMARCKQPSVVRVESGQNVSLRMLHRLAEALGVGVKDFFG